LVVDVMIGEWLGFDGMIGRGLEIDGMIGPGLGLMAWSAQDSG
jgi:hypothetical protein